MDTSTQLLVVTGLGKAYQTRNGDKGQRALRDVDFTAEPGELITVIGPSGAGKSTFLRCINRLIEPTDGTVTFCGQDITHLSRGQLRPVHRQIAMIFQNYNLVYRLTAIQNVLHGRLGYKNVLAGSLGLYTEEEKIARSSSSTRWVSASSPTAAQTSSPAARNSAWALRAPSCRSPRSCSATSRLPRLIPRAPAWSWSSCVASRVPTASPAS